MAGQTWSISIIPGSSGAGFVPDVYSDNPTDVLQAQNGDIISWNNQTGDEHQPWQTDATFAVGSGPNVQLCDVIAPFGSSSPGFCPDQDDTPSTIYYACRIHPQEQGTIEVVQ